MSTDHEPIDRQIFVAADLMAEHPPRIGGRNKRAVFEIACPPTCVHRGSLEYSRWQAAAPPAQVDPHGAADLVAPRDGFYEYSAETDLQGAIEWHVNFADRNVFAFYGTSLLAQDELMVAEHPALGALREALVAHHRPSTTLGAEGPTPILVMGVERRCTIATLPDACAGRPHGLYGNRFARADEDTVRRATSAIDPPSISNVIAIAAPSGGTGAYTARQIRSVLTTAYSGFVAAALESTRVSHGREWPVVVHTGFWGCGAFGGNRVLMAALQALAAQLAGLRRLVFHVGDSAGGEALESARRILRGDVQGAPPTGVPELIEWFAGLGFPWGVSDGN